MTYIPDELHQKALRARTATRQCVNSLLWLVFTGLLCTLPAAVIHVWKVLV